MTVKTPCTPLVSQGCKIQSLGAVHAVPDAIKWIPEVYGGVSFSGQRPGVGFLVFSAGTAGLFALDVIAPYLLLFGVILENFELLPGTFAKIYKQHGVLAHGVRVGWSDSRVYVSIPATALELLPSDKLWHALASILELPDLRVNRIDLSIDDFDRIASPATLARSVAAGSLVSRCLESSVKPHVFFRDRKLSTSGIEFGSRKSDTFLRVYDKTIEMQKRNDELLQAAPHEYDFIRWELELHDERALKAVTELVGRAVVDWHGYIWGLVVNHVDFRSPSDNANVTRRKRLYWFSKLTRGAKRIFLNVSKPPDTLAKVRRWLFAQVSPSLALLERAGGAELMTQLLDEGRNRLTNKRLRLLSLKLPRMSEIRLDSLLERFLRRDSVPDDVTDAVIVSMAVASPEPDLLFGQFFHAAGVCLTDAVHQKRFNWDNATGRARWDAEQKLKKTEMSLRLTVPSL